MPKPFYYLGIEKLRKDYVCIICSKVIPKGSYALKEHGYNDYEKYFLNYIHLDKENRCYSDYIDDQHPEVKILKMVLDVDGKLVVNRAR